MGDKPYSHQTYPGWRYHPVKDAVLVKDQTEDDKYDENDGWRHEPYSDDEKADLQTVDDVPEVEPVAPIATEFTSKVKYEEAKAQYKKDSAAFKKAKKK